MFENNLVASFVSLSCILGVLVSIFHLNRLILTWNIHHLLSDVVAIVHTKLRPFHLARCSPTHCKTSQQYSRSISLEKCYPTRCIYRMFLLQICICFAYAQHHFWRAVQFLSRNRKSAWWMYCFSTTRLLPVQNELAD